MQQLLEFGCKLVTSLQLENDGEPKIEFSEEEMTIVNPQPIPKTCEHCKAVHNFPAGMIFSNPDNPDFGSEDGYKDSLYYCFKCLLSMFGIVSKMLAVKEERDGQTYRGQFALPGTGE